MSPLASTVPPCPAPITDAVPARRWLWFVLVGLLLVDLAKHVLLLWSGLEQPWPDSAGYWRLGTDVAGGDFWMREAALGYRAPGYPWFLGGAIRLLGQDAGYVAAIAVQHAAALATDVLVAWWTWRLTASRGATLAAFAWMALSTARPLYANWILTESLATLCLALTGYLLSWNPGPDLRRSVAAAIAAGVGILIRPSLIVLAPVLGLVVIADAWRKPASTGRRLVRAIMPLLVLFGILLPWCGRNAQLFGRWTLVTFTGRELWTANFSPWPGAALDVPAEGAAEDLRRRVALSPTVVDLRHNTGVAGALVRSGLSDADADRLMEQVAWEAIHRAPARSLIHDFARMGTFWYCKEYPHPSIHAPAAAPGPVAATEGPRPVLPSLARPLDRATARWTAALLALSPERTFLFTWAVSGLTWVSLGLCLLDPARRRASAVLGALLVGTTVLTALLEIPLYRYRLPLEPLGVVVIMAGLTTLVSRLRAAPVGKDKRS